MEPMDNILVKWYYPPVLYVTHLAIAPFNSTSLAFGVEADGTDLAGALPLSIRVA